MRKKFASILYMILLLPLLPILGAIKVKSADEVARKWGEVTPQRSAYYEAGAVGSGDDWEKNTAGAAGAYRAAVTAPNVEAMFRGGVKKAGAAKYNRKVQDVGVQRFGQGVAAAVEDMKTGVAPMLDTIAGLTLSARAPRGSDANYRRVQEVGTALHKKRLALRAAGA
jgi:hypothetical protein